MDKNGYDTSRKIVTKEPYRGYHIIKTKLKCQILMNTHLMLIHQKPTNT